MVALFGLPTWLTVMLAAGAAVFLLPLVALIVPLVVGWLEGFREGLRGSSADPDLLERFRSMTINDVRRRADDFELRTRREPAIYRVPAVRWRRLEAAMRDAGAAEVGDLSAEEVEIWGRRLQLRRDDHPLPGQTGLTPPEPGRRTVGLPARSAARGRLLLLRWPGPRRKRPRR